MWGQAAYCPIVSGITGIIPTRVGTRAVAVLPQPILKDHPHACGDKLIVFVQGHDFVGSSPRVWGQVGRLRMLIL